MFNDVSQITYRPLSPEEQQNLLANSARILEQLPEVERDRFDGRNVEDLLQAARCIIERGVCKNGKGTQNGLRICTEPYAHMCAHYSELGNQGRCWWIDPTK
jgi:hypothetical protein